MLTLHGITKIYATAGETVHALRGVDLCFRRQEFVSILGHSGCGKTTLLNIIGGLDQYTDGDLQIEGVSTKDFSDRDWDSYRNHRIGFVFQSYHLIPHQTVLSNVELALTLSGVSRAERRRRAKEALEKVGLADQMHKKPTQMSGGQMQRVAIARALVNNPEILLADEPTGALDTATSEQIMDLLSEVAKDRLVIMVTHNPELAEQYSSRIIRFSDGQVVSDTHPCSLEEATADLPKTEEAASEPQKKTSRNGSPYQTVKRKKHQTKREDRTSMSLFSAISLSLDNLLTKKTRTFLTSFAGSIGIIGIALVLALSNGIELYIDRVEEDALSSYPITLESVTMDMGEILSTLTGNGAGGEVETEDGYVYSSQALLQMMNAMISGIKTNDLVAFKEYLENESNIDDPDVATVVYEYGITPNIWHMYDDGKGNTKPVQTSPSSVMNSMMSMSGMGGGLGLSLFDQMLDNQDLLDAQYDILEGHWPTSFDEVVLVTDTNHQINDLFLYALGFKNPDEVKDMMADLLAGKQVEVKNDKYTYEELMSKTFTLVVQGDFYTDENGDGIYEFRGEDDAFIRDVLASADTEGSRTVTLKIAGIVKPKKDAAATSISGAVGYTTALVDYLLEQSANTPVVKAQLENPQVDVLTGLPYAGALAGEIPSVEEQAKQMQKILSAEGKDRDTLLQNWSKWVEPKLLYARMREAAEKITTLTAEMPQDVKMQVLIANLAQLFVSHQEEIAEIPGLGMGDMGAMGGLDANTIAGFIQMAYEGGQMTEAQITESVIGLVAYFGMEDVVEQTLAEAVAEKRAEIESNAGEMTEQELAEAYEADLATLTEAELSYLWQEEYGAVSPNSYSGILRWLGYAKSESPNSILIYPISFEQKDYINREISKYNSTKPEAKKIVYTDYIGVLFSSISMILNIVTYVLVAFASISLVVSSIMIGIITYISVLERTKEIGILRAVGASKRDVSRVFNAETLMIGFVAGVIGVLATLVLSLPINAIIRYLSGISYIGAKLPLTAAILLVIISVVITVISGLIPSRIAAKKDPVEALRTE